MDRASTRTEGEGRFVRHLDWNLLPIFVAIVDHGGISAAARRLGRRQPSVSAALARLEDHVGARLCERTAKGVVLTPAGQALFEIATALRRQVGQIPLALAMADGVIEGQVALHMVSGVVSPVLDAALGRFHGQHPAVELRLVVAPWRGVIAALLAGEAEIGVACDSAPALDLDYLPLMREVQQLFCGPGHPRHGQAGAHPAALRDEAFVLTGQDEPDELAYFRRRYGLGTRVSGRAETLGEAQRLIQLGVGIGFLPVDLAHGQGLWPLLSEALLPAYDIYLVSRRSPPIGAPARLLLQHVSAALDKADQPWTVPEP